MLPGTYAHALNAVLTTNGWLATYRELGASGVNSLLAVPALNTNPTFIDDLAEAVLEALPYVGSMAGSNPSDAMVPLGMHDTIRSVAAVCIVVQCLHYMWS